MFTGLDPPASTPQEDSAVGYTNELALQDSEGIPGEDAGPEAGSSSLTIEQRTNQLEIAANFDVDGDGDIGEDMAT